MRNAIYGPLESYCISCSVDILHLEEDQNLNCFVKLPMEVSPLMVSLSPNFRRGLG